MLEGKIKLLLEMAGDLSLQELDEALEHHQRQVDMLRLLRQITVIREESQFVGDSSGAPEVKNEQTFNRLAHTLELPENPPEQPVKQLPNKRDSSLTEPIPTTVPYRIRQLLKDGKPRTASQITSELESTCSASIYQALSEWSRKGLFQKDKNRCWSLCQPNSNGIAPILPAKPPLQASTMAPTVLSPPKEGTAAYRVLELLRDGKSRSAVQMEECLNLPQSTICNILKTWERRGYFKKLEKRQWTICDVPVSQHRPLPALGSTAYGIMEILSDGTVKQTKDIRKALGDISWSTVVNAMAVWEAKGLFEQVGHGAWRLKQDVKEEELEEIITPKNYFDDGEELSVKIQDKPYQGNAFRVLAHVQRNQPCKPALMAYDLHLELSEVLSILGDYACFRSEADGWVITNGEMVRS